MKAIINIINRVPISIVLIGLVLCTGCKKDEPIHLADKFRHKVWEGTCSYGNKLPEPYSISFGDKDSLKFDFVEGSFGGRYEIIEAERKLKFNIGAGKIIYEAVLSDKDTLNAFTSRTGIYRIYTCSQNNQAISDLTGTKWKGFLSPMISIAITFSTSSLAQFETGINYSQQLPYVVKNGTLRFASIYGDYKCFGLVKGNTIEGSYLGIAGRWPFIMTKK